MAIPINSNIRYPQSQFLDPLTQRPAREWLIWLQNPDLVSSTVNYVIINGGDINNTPIGDITPSTGVFTNLTALLGIGGGQF